MRHVNVWRLSDCGIISSEVIPVTITTAMWAMCVMMFFGVVFIIVLIGATTYLVIRTLMKKIRVDDYPLRILKERFVKGEIDDEEYRQKRKMLSETYKWKDWRCGVK
ncbi:MAG: SHOCT domain-containing protein [Paenibacillaceae bacterium]